MTDRPSASPIGLRTGCALAAGALAADQLTKAIVLEQASRLAEGMPVLPGFALVFVWNPGISFGAFGGVGPWALSALALAVTAAMAVWMWRERSGLVVAALGLIIGGALGNVLDRLRHGAVVDFLDLSVGTYHWPAFNLADTAITVGAILMIWDTFAVRQPARPTSCNEND